VCLLSFSSLLVQTDKGLVQGYTSKNVDKWRGIPYAAPPVGDLRFALPQPAAAWTGTIEATLAGPICPQLYGLFPGQWSGKEDCLYANIYAPANRSLSEPLPVLVWIYGGGSVHTKTKEKIIGGTNGRIDAHAERRHCEVDLK